MVAAISGSTMRDGTSTTPSAARLSVMLWAMVKPVTILTIGQKPRAKASNASRNRR
jgi:hypothetical protein